MSERQSFLSQAINDIQSTIRAIDVKIGFLFVVIFFPLTQLKELLAYLHEAHKLFGWSIILVWGVIVCWFFSLYMLMMSVGAISNPANKVKGSRGAGYFHGAGLYDLYWSDLFINSRVKSEKSIDELMAAIPTDTNGLESEFVFELLKISYIRDVKAKRFIACLRATFLWIVLSAVLVGVNFFALGSN